MYSKDEILLEQAYYSIYEDNNPFQPASEDNVTDRELERERITKLKMQRFIDGGCEGVLSISGAPIKSLPSDITEIDGNLYADKSHLTELPEDFKITGHLFINNTNITSLPSGLEVGGFLNISNTNIDDFPDDIQLSGKVFYKNTPLSDNYTPEELAEKYPHIGDLFKPGLAPSQA